MEDEQILVAFGVVVLGYFIQYWYSKKLESQKHQRDLRTGAYVDFIKGAVGMAITQKDKPNEEHKFKVILADAKARISIYGSKEVIESIANFWRDGAILDTPERRRAFISICQTIRKEAKETLPKDQNVLNKEISQLLFEID